jgi:cytochrome c peroxidase
MIRSFCIGFLASLTAVCGVSVMRLGEERLDDALSRIVWTINLAPLETKPLVADPRYQLGQALFFDSLVSGDGTVACSTCHLPSRSTTDGIPVSIGPGGLGSERKSVGFGAVLNRSPQPAAPVLARAAG